MTSFDPKTLLANLPNLPGVYQMLNANGKILYVGKARNLKKRVSSYFQRALVDSKTIALMSEVQAVNYTVTNSENEALLLENNLIKKFHPRYNILYRDDKSYPYLYLSPHPDFPRLDIYRGPRHGSGQYFGPFPNVAAVRDTLSLLQKIFKIRQCSDNFFKLRTRPCLQYYIQRCTAPCVGYVDVATYQANVHLAVLFLQGKNQEVINELVKKMDIAAENLAFEDAARYRDQIASLRRVQERQYVEGEEGDIDVIGIAHEAEEYCLQVLFIRGGRLLGNKPYFVPVLAGTVAEETLAAFLPQYYLNTVRGELLPAKVIVGLKLADKDWIAAALSQELAQKIEIITQPRGKERQWLQLATTNAKYALASHQAERNHFYERFEALQHALHLPNLPTRMVCFDVSHTLGEATVASCVVFDTDGPVKAEYRRFNIKDVTKGDDYAALNQALTRYFTRLKEGEAALPDLLIIDGGKGQLSQAEAVVEELQISGLVIMAIAKGPSRKPGLETLFISGHKTPLHLPPDSAALHLLQQIRDEAHRFAIVGHRKQRSKARTTSPLQSIPGIGPKRRRELLRQLGGWQEIQRASVEQLASVPGISKALAQQIYDHLHQ